ncbi:MAG TPA: hypothetical protein VIO58_13315 [Candidatus Methanoperedens sp.]
MRITVTERTICYLRNQAALPGTCAQLPPKNGARQVDAADATAQVAIPTAAGI